MYPYEQEGRQRGQEISLDEQGDPGKTQTEGGSIQHVEKGPGHLGGIYEHCQSMQGCDEEGQGPFENLSRDVKDNKKSFFRYINSKSKSRENVRLLLNGVGALATNYTMKAELLNTFFASGFTAKSNPQEFQNLETRGSLEKGGLYVG